MWRMRLHAVLQNERKNIHHHFLRLVSNNIPKCQSSDFNSLRKDSFILLGFSVYLCFGLLDFYLLSHVHAEPTVNHMIVYIFWEQILD